MNQEALESEIFRRINVLLQGLEWRPHFSQWVESRVWAELQQDQVIAELNRLAPDLEHQLVLELGSGMGGLLVALQRNDINAVGLEYNEEYCTISRLRGQRYGLETAVIHGQAEAIPLADQSIDIVVCREVIEHVFDPEKVLKESWRVLKPGGLMLMTVPNRWALFDPHYHLWGVNLLPRRLADGLTSLLGLHKQDGNAGMQKLSTMHYFTYKSISKLCRKVGFKVTDLRKERIEEKAGKGGGIARRSAHLLTGTPAFRPTYALYQSLWAQTFPLLLTKERRFG